MKPHPQTIRIGLSIIAVGVGTETEKPAELPSLSLLDSFPVLVFRIYQLCPERAGMPGSKLTKREPRCGNDSEGRDFRIIFGPFWGHTGGMWPSISGGLQCSENKQTGNHFKSFSNFLMAPLLRFLIAPSETQSKRIQSNNCQ
jgi:hypothetical protein